MYFVIDNKETKSCVLAHSGKFLNSLFYMLISVLHYRGTTSFTHLKISLNVNKFPLWKKDPSGV
jgi:predicted RNA-binding protein Jag